MTVNLRDPLRGALFGRGIVHGDKHIGCPYVPITPEERDKLIQRLTHDERDMVCTSCGSTKPMTYFQAVGAVSCCEAREMIPAADMLAELNYLRLIAPEEPCSQAMGVTFGAKVPAFARGVSGEAVSARVALNSAKTGTRMFVNFTKALAQHVNTPRVDARYGTGLDADKILLTFGDQGAFQFCRDQKSRKFYVILPPPAQLQPGQKAVTKPCDYGWHTVGAELVVTLPISSWMPAKLKVAA